MCATLFRSALFLCCFCLIAKPLNSPVNLRPHRALGIRKKCLALRSLSLSLCVLFRRSFKGAAFFIIRLRPALFEFFLSPLRTDELLTWRPATAKSGRFAVMPFDRLKFAKRGAAANFNIGVIFFIILVTQSFIDLHQQLDEQVKLSLDHIVRATVL